MKKVIYLEESREKYSETFVRYEKQKLKNIGIKVDEIVLSELSINVFGLLSIKTFHCLLIGLFLSIRSLPNCKRFISNLHASLLVSSNLKLIGEKIIGAYELRSHFLAKRTTAAFLISKIFNKEYTSVAHAADIFDWDGSIQKKILEAKRIDVISNYNLGYIQAKLNFKSSEKIKLIRNSFNESISSDSPKSNKTNRFLIVTRFVEKKGILEALDIFSMYKDKYEDAYLDIAGDGPLYDSVVRKIKNLKLDGYVTLHGVLDQKKIAELLQLADAFILLSKIASPNFKDMDGIPTVFFESLYAGKPVITNAVSGIPEIIHDGFNGLFIDDKDKNTIVNKMRDLISNANASDINKYFKILANYDVTRFYK